MNKSLKKAIAIIGGPAALARILGIRSQAVSQWIVAPPKRVRAIEAATGGRVTAFQLRPDVFGKAA